MPRTRPSATRSRPATSERVADAHRSATPTPRTTEGGRTPCGAGSTGSRRTLPSSATPAVAVLGTWLMVLDGRPLEAERWIAASEDAPGSLASEIEGSRSLVRALMCRDGVAVMLDDARRASSVIGPVERVANGRPAPEGLGLLTSGEPDAATDRFRASAEESAERGTAVGGSIAHAELAERLRSRRTVSTRRHRTWTTRATGHRRRQPPWVSDLDPGIRGGRAAQSRAGRPRPSAKLGRPGHLDRAERSPTRCRCSPCRRASSSRGRPWVSATRRWPARSWPTPRPWCSAVLISAP